MATKFGGKNPWPEPNALLGGKGHAWVSWSQPEVKLLRNAIMATKFGRKNPWSKYNSLLGSDVMQGSVGVNQRSFSFGNALWPLNLVERTPDQSIMHWWGHRSYRVSRGQPEVSLLRNDLWLPNLVGRTPA